MEPNSPSPIELAVIDYQKLNGTPAERAIELKTLDLSLRSLGFFYLSNHTISQEMVNKAYKWNKNFFDVSIEGRNTIAHPGDVKDHRGFVKTGFSYVSQLVFDQDKVKQLRKISPEAKEAFEMGNPNARPQNRWLSEDILPGFRAFAESWWDECIKLNESLLRSLCEALHLDDLDSLGKPKERDTNGHMSWIHYPSVPLKSLQNSDLRRINPHSDFGQITILFPDPNIGGLEVNDNGIYRPILPRAGTAVINVGDILERQTNGRWKSSLHRVVAPSNGREEEAVKDRYSVVYFGSLDPKSLVRTLPGCEEMGKWKPNMIGDWGDTVTAREWVSKRVAAEY